MSDIYRSDAVKKLRDPQQLDTAIRLTSPSGWLALAALGLIVVMFMVWVFLGALPFQSSGLGILLQRDSEIFDLPSPTNGQIAKIEVAVGDTVKKDQQLAVINVPETEADFQAAQRVLDNLNQQLVRQRSQNATEITEQRRIMNSSIAAQQRKIDDLNAQITYLSNRRQGEEEELQRGFITRDTLEETIQSLASARQQVRTAEVEISSLRASQNEKEQTSRREISELEQQILEAENNLNEVRARRDIQHVVNSPIDGVVEEVATKVGDAVSAGAQLFIVSQVGEGLQMFAYLPISKGKRVTPGMAAKVSPSTVERDIFGSINGTVVSVSPLPATEAELSNRISNADLVESMLSDGAPIEIVINLENDPNTFSGLDWSTSAGPAVRISPGTTATASITVREVRPIDLFIPIVQTWVTGR